MTTGALTPSDTCSHFGLSVVTYTPTDYPKSVRNCCVIEDFGGVFVFSRCFF